MNFFNIICPSKELAPYIRHYWHFQIDANQRFIDKIVPIGCVYMLFQLGDNPLYDYTRKDFRPRIFVCGQESELSDVGSNGDTELLTVVFQPYAAKTFFNMPMNLIYKQRIDVNDLDDNELKNLATRVANEKSADNGIRLIEDFMCQRLNHITDYHLKRITAVVRDIVINPDHSLMDFSDIACLSPKQLSRVFMETVGASPKVLSRIVRVRKALFLLRSNLYSLSQISYKCGFTDSSHMNKEFKIFTNCTPMEYLCNYQLDRDPYSEYIFASSDTFKM